MAASSSGAQVAAIADDTRGDAGPAAAQNPAREKPRIDLRRAEWEPLTILPDRLNTLRADVDMILRDFELKLLTEQGAAAGPWTISMERLLPRSGAFAVFRSLYVEYAFSMVLEAEKPENGRDLFQFACGVCWSIMAATESLVRQAAVVFLVYLLFYSQHPGQSAIPVDVRMLELMESLRRRCMRHQVLLDCPAVVRRMVVDGVFSVGILPTCRNLFFDRAGHVVLRRPTPPPVEALVADGGQRQLAVVNPYTLAAADTPATVRAHRLKVRQAQPPGVGDALTTSTGTEILNLSGLAKDASAYAGASAALLDASAGEDGSAGPGLDAGTAAGSIVNAVQRYKRGTPPPQQPLSLAEGVPATSEAAVVPVRDQAKKRERRKRKPVIGDVSDSDDDPLWEHLGDKVSTMFRTVREAAEYAKATGTEYKPPVHLKSKRMRRSTVLGVQDALRRQEARAAQEAAAAAAASAEQCVPVADATAAESSVAQPRTPQPLQASEGPAPASVASPKQACGDPESASIAASIPQAAMPEEMADDAKNEEDEDAMELDEDGDDYAGYI
eukprot:TRINITY_DN34078_c0_g1_i1.p1 TRINITY_DN34078_c0_g1~~TRINITY_DN34078_c0_g1_i1.p1  ORF type:complete len:557 (-),score=82.56 TRINITY_DN34078_c0_g1_i1:180-1850(-)